MVGIGALVANISTVFKRVKELQEENKRLRSLLRAAVDNVEQLLEDETCASYGGFVCTGDMREHHTFSGFQPTDCLLDCQRCYWQRLKEKAKFFQKNRYAVLSEEDVMKAKRQCREVCIAAGSYDSVKADAPRPK